MIEIIKGRELLDLQMKIRKKLKIGNINNDFFSIDYYQILYINILQKKRTIIILKINLF